jgi:hypothetical protein
MAFRLSASIITPLVGLAVDRWGLSLGFVILGSAFSVLVLILSLPLSRRMHELRVEYIPASEGDQNG